LKIFYRIAACIILSLGLTAVPAPEASAKSAKKQAKASKAKAKTATRPNRSATRKAPAPAEMDPKLEFELIDEEAVALNNALALAPDDRQNQQRQALLALRAARAAEKAVSRGDDSLYGRYTDQFRHRFAQTQPALSAIAGRGVPAAEYALGLIALHGLIGQEDAKAGCGHFAAAFEKGFGGAKYRHAQCIHESDAPKAIALLREAADSGHVAANESLGRICLEARPSDVECAFTHLERAARDGRASATTLLAWMYAEGVGGKADPARAATLYKTAAQKGEPSARNNLGELFESGRGVAKNEKIAFEHYLAAAQSGFAPGQFNVGRLYAAGRGTESDIEEARRWLSRADEAGIPQAAQILQYLAQAAK